MTEKKIDGRYWRRDGGLTLPLVKSKDPRYPLMDPMTGLYYSSNGRHDVTKETLVDLIDEYVDPLTEAEKDE